MPLSAISPSGKHNNHVHICPACLLNVPNISSSGTVLRVVHNVASHYNLRDTFHNKTVLSYLWFSWTVKWQTEMFCVSGWLHYCCCLNCQSNGSAVCKRLGQNKWVCPIYNIKCFSSGALLPSCLWPGICIAAVGCSGVRNIPLLCLKEWT